MQKCFENSKTDKILRQKLKPMNIMDEPTLPCVLIKQKKQCGKRRSLLQCIIASCSEKHCSCIVNIYIYIHWYNLEIHNLIHINTQLWVYKKKIMCRRTEQISDQKTPEKLKKMNCTNIDQKYLNSKKYIIQRKHKKM